MLTVCFYSDFQGFCPFLCGAQGPMTMLWAPLLACPTVRSFLDSGVRRKVPPRDLPGLGKSRELQVIRHSGGSRNPGKSLDPGFRRGDGPWHLGPGFSLSVVTDRSWQFARIMERRPCKSEVNITCYKPQKISERFDPCR